MDYSAKHWGSIRQMLIIQTVGAGGLTTNERKKLDSQSLQLREVLEGFWVQSFYLIEVQVPRGLKRQHNVNDLPTFSTQISGSKIPSTIHIHMSPGTTLCSAQCVETRRHK